MASFLGLCYASRYMRSIVWAVSTMLCGVVSAQQLQPRPASPVSVGLVFDTSGSMGGKLRASRDLVNQIIKTSTPQDEFFLVEFNDHPVLRSALTSRTEDIESHLAFVQSKGRSALWDAIYLSLNEMKNSHNPVRALLVISDGEDNSSRYSENDIQALALSAGVHVYTVGVHERSAEGIDYTTRLRQIAEQSGGKHFSMERLDDVPGIASRLNADLRSAANNR